MQEWNDIPAFFNWTDFPGYGILDTMSKEGGRMDDPDI